MAAIDEAEKRAGEPPRLADICAVLESWNSIFTPLKSGMPMHGVIMCLMREDLIYIDNEKYYRFSTKPHKDYSTFSEAFRRNCPNFDLDQKQTCIAKASSRTVNINKLIEILKSKDEKLLTENAWMFDGEFRFLDGAKIPDGFKIAFDTWPRTGNTFLRRYLE